MSDEETDVDKMCSHMPNPDWGQSVCIHCGGRLDMAELKHFLKIGTVEDQKEWLRQHIHSTITRTEEFIKQTGPSRELSLTKTKLEEALMWFTK